MRAWQVVRLGEPAQALHLGERPALAPRTGEAIVEVTACGCNFSDVLLCRGEYQEHPTPPFTPGTEVVGSMIAVGDGVSGPIGSHVLARALLPDGGLAEQARISGALALPLPDHLDDVTAAALHVTYQTAWFAVHRRARVRAGETVLVHAGAGATGSAAVQIALAAGARVITTAGGATKVDACLRLGADLALDHRADDVRAAVLDATAGLGADVVIDPVGGDLFDISRRCVAFEGRIVVVGFASGRIADLPTNHAMVKNYSVLGLQWPLYERHRPDLVRRAHDEILRLHAAGHIVPLVPNVRTLDDAADALEDLAAGRTIGKTVVRP